MAFDKIADPAVLPVNVPRGLAFSPDGQLLVCAVAVTGERVLIYSIVGDVFTKMVSPVANPPGTANGCAFSPDGSLLAVSHANSPFFTVYAVSGAGASSTFTKIADPASLPGGLTGNDVAFSADGQYLAVASSTSSPRGSVYSISGSGAGTTLTKISPFTAPTPNTNRADFSPDSQFLVLGTITTPFIYIYQIASGAFTKLSDPASLPVSDSRGVVFSPDGTLLSVAGANYSPYVANYAISGTTFTKLANPAALPPGSSTNAAWSNNGQYLTLVSSVAPYVTRYLVADSGASATFTKQPDLATAPTGGGLSVAFSPGDKFMAVGHSTSPLLSIYATGITPFVEMSWGSRI